MALVFTVLIAGILVIEHFGIDRLRRAVAALQIDTLTATFPICGAEHRVTCVIDGDTF